MTTDNNDGLNFVTKFPTASVTSSVNICMKCSKVTNNMGTLTLSGGKVTFEVESCDNYVTITQPNTNYAYYVTDTSAGSQQSTIFTDYSDFFSTTETTWCAIQGTNLQHGSLYGT